MVKMTQKSWYITWEGCQRKGIEKHQRKKTKGLFVLAENEIQKSFSGK